MAISGSNGPLYDTFERLPLQFDYGEGSRLFTHNGEEYLDFAAGIAVNSLGYSHPHLVEALKSQSKKLWHVSNLYEIPGQFKLGKRLCEISFADRVFFTNSGSEAIECAFKTARRWHYANGEPERIDIITFEGAFHGRTLGAIAASGNEKYTTGFGPKAPGFIQVPFDDFDKLTDAIGKTTAAILIEPVQGEAGIRPIPNNCLRNLRELCNKESIFLIYDEVQCGVGRTGKLFTYEWADSAAPDIMAIAKGIGGGFPLGACLATEKAASAMQPGTHGTTYGGNPLAMAVGNAVLDIILEEGFLENIQRTTLLLTQKLAKITNNYPDLIQEFRGSGLMQGLKCKISNIKIVRAFCDQNLLTAPAGNNVVRLLPPLMISENDICDAYKKMDAALSKIRKSD
ncbi:aspartate aminotransferase family protein [Candidatus Endowatersipora endosymbiont of Watersipora subatra]|uniref:aspartate aminotransferase family protein n=1 Tax=Candidatus Endowatersipora endosymbiont of Watersipora subatra TaxID=3077946 RepID=UPI003C7AFC83